MLPALLRACARHRRARARRLLPRSSSSSSSSSTRTRMAILCSSGAAGLLAIWELGTGLARADGEGGRAAQLVEDDAVETSELVVIGGGIVGASVALHAARCQRDQGRPVDVVLLEKQHVGSGATGMSAGTIWSGGDGRPQNFAEYLCNETVQILKEIQGISDGLSGRHRVANGDDQEAEAAFLDCELVQSGALTIALSEAERQRVHGQYKSLISRGYEAKYLPDASSVKAYEPNLSTKVVAALVTPKSGHCNPKLTAEALADLAGASGAQIREEEAVLGVFRPKAGPEASRFILQTSKGYILTNNVVIASGHQFDYLRSDASKVPLKTSSGEIFSPVYVSVPVVGVKGQIWSTKPLPSEQGLRGPIFTSQAALFWSKHSSRDDTASLPIPEYCTHDRHGKRIARHAYGRQTADGRVIFGCDRVRCSDRDFELSKEGLDSCRQTVGRFLPKILDEEVEGVWTGIMPFSRDGKPLLGELDDAGLPGAWVAVGFGPHGIMEGPGAGKAIAEAIVKKTKIPRALNVLRPSRKHDGCRVHFEDR